jgi:hypothetical protein
MSDDTLAVNEDAIAVGIIPLPQRLQNPSDINDASGEP